MFRSFSRQYDLSFLCWWVLTIVSCSIRLLLCSPPPTPSIQSKSQTMNYGDFLFWPCLGFWILSVFSTSIIQWSSGKCSSAQDDSWIVGFAQRSSIVSRRTSVNDEWFVFHEPLTKHLVTFGRRHCVFLRDVSFDVLVFVHVQWYSLILFCSHFSIYSRLLCANIFCLRRELKSFNDLEYFVCFVFRTLTEHKISASLRATANGFLGWLPEYWQTRAEQRYIGWLCFVSEHKRKYASSSLRAIITIVWQLALKEKKCSSFLLINVCHLLESIELLCLGE